MLNIYIYIYLLTCIHTFIAIFQLTNKKKIIYIYIYIYIYIV